MSNKLTEDQLLNQDVTFYLDAAKQHSVKFHLINKGGVFYVSVLTTGDNRDKLAVIPSSHNGLLIGIIADKPSQTSKRKKKEPVASPEITKALNCLQE